MMKLWIKKWGVNKMIIKHMKTHAKYYDPENGNSLHSIIKFEGFWLQKNGFPPNQPIKVTVLDFGKILIEREEMI